MKLQTSKSVKERAPTLQVLEAGINSQLEELRQQGMLREYREIERYGEDAIHARVDGRDCLLFSTQDYLGLSRHPAILGAMKDTIDRYGSGTCGSRFLGGTTPLHHEAERALANLHNREAAVLYANGYMANAGTISALASAGDIIFSDELNHASIVDGCRLSRAQKIIWRHNDVDHLRWLLENNPAARERFIILESVYSMGGDFAPLREVVELAEEFGCFIYVDEIHAVGVFGRRGDGYAAELGISDRVDLIMAGAGKALGSFGGYVIVSNDLATLLKSKARAFIFTTSLPPMIMSAIIKAVEIVIEATPLRLRIRENAAYLREHLDLCDFDYLNSQSHVVPVVTGTPETTTRVTEMLLEDGLFAQGAIYPSVPLNEGRLRISVTPAHTRAQIRGLVSSLLRVREAIPSFLERRRRVGCSAD